MHIDSMSAILFAVDKTKRHPGRYVFYVVTRYCFLAKFRSRDSFAKPRRLALSSKFIKLAEQFTCFANEAATVIKYKYFDFDEVNKRWKVRF